jgi:hypothetical protein
MLDDDDDIPEVPESEIKRRGEAIERGMKQPPPGYGQSVSDITLKSFIKRADKGLLAPFEILLIQAIAEDLAKLRNYMEVFEKTAYLHPAVGDTLRKALRANGAKESDLAWVAVMESLHKKIAEGEARGPAGLSQ